MNVALLVPAQTAFGEDVRPWARPGAQRQRHDFLGMAHSVNGSGVDPVNAKLESAMNRVDRLFVVLLTPTEFPTRSADSPRAKADWCDEQVGVTELLRFHINLLEFRFHVSGLLARIRSKRRMKRAGPRTAELQPARQQRPSRKGTSQRARASCLPSARAKRRSILRRCCLAALYSQVFLVSLSFFESQYQFRLISCWPDPVNRATAAFRWLSFQLPGGYDRFDNGSARCVCLHRKAHQSVHCNNRVARDRSERH